MDGSRQVHAEAHADAEAGRLGSGSLSGESADGLHPLAAALAVVRSGTVALGDVPAWTTPEDVLLDMLRDLTAVTDLLEAQRLRLHADADERGCAQARRMSDMAGWLQAALQVRG